jgi:hypothetical protein
MLSYVFLLFSGTGCLRNTTCYDQNCKKLVYTNGTT